MIAPSIHLNGTGKAALIAALEAASDALIAALRAVEATAPNGRDYHPQGPSAIATAQREHAARLARLVDTRREIVDMWEMIEDGEVSR